MIAKPRSRHLSTALMIGIALVWSGVLSANVARADLVYAYVFDQPIYSVAPGELVDVRISLLETVTGGDVSLLATEGLIGASARVVFDLAPSPSDPATVETLAHILPNVAEFDDPAGLDTDLAPGSSAGFAEAVQIASPAVFGTMIAPNQYQIVLGVFRFTAGMVPGETTFLSAMDRSGADETITGASGIVLDGLIQTGSARIEVRPIPEPSSLILLMIAAPGFALFRRRASRISRQPSRESACEQDVRPTAR